LARVIEQAGVFGREKIRAALESLPPYRGLIKYYDPPFSSDRHEALEGSDYRLGRYNKDGFINNE
jgi:branched-chain amino acid transport system substrate-binding protein